MPKLPVVSGADLIKFLTKRGFKHVRTTGSHYILKSADGRILVPVPLHSELDRGTLKGILEIIGMSRDQFMAEW